MSNDLINRQYVGARYVPKVVGEWDKALSYEALSIVTYMGNSFTSKIPVPANIDISNETYWTNTGNYNAQLEKNNLLLSKLNTKIDNLKICNVDDYETNCDITIMNHIDEFDAFYIPSGTHNIINGITLQNISNKIIFGNGTLSTENNSINLIKLVNCSYIEIYGINLYANNNNNYLISLSDNVNINFERINIHDITINANNSKGGIEIDNINGSTFTNIAILNGTEYGIKDHGYDNYFDKIDINSALTGFYESGNNNHITNLKCWYNKNDGCYITGNFNELSIATFQENGRYGLNIINCTNSYIQGLCDSNSRLNNNSNLTIDGTTNCNIIINSVLNQNLETNITSYCEFKNLNNNNNIILNTDSRNVMSKIGYPISIESDYPLNNNNITINGEIYDTSFDKIYVKSNGEINKGIATKTYTTDLLQRRIEFDGIGDNAYTGFTLGVTELKVPSNSSKLKINLIGKATNSVIRGYIDFYNDNTKISGITTPFIYDNQYDYSLSTTVDIPENTTKIGYGFNCFSNTTDTFNYKGSVKLCSIGII